MNKKPVFKLVVANLSKKSKDDPEMNSKLWDKKMAIDALAREAVKLLREARAAGARYQIVAAQKAMAIEEFLTLGAQVDDRIAVEESAMPPYTNKDGEMCVDIPFTQREQRLAVRAAHKQLENAVGDTVDPDMFESDDEDEDNDGKGGSGRIGF